MRLFALREMVPVLGMASDQEPRSGIVDHPRLGMSSFMERSK